MDKLEKAYQFIKGDIEFAPFYKEYLEAYVEVMQESYPHLKEDEILKLFVDDIFKEVKNIEKVDIKK